jgi:hypothetical protein
MNTGTVSRTATFDFFHFGSITLSCCEESVWLILGEDWKIRNYGRKLMQNVVVPGRRLCWAEYSQLHASCGCISPSGIMVFIDCCLRFFGRLSKPLRNCTCIL